MDAFELLFMVFVLGAVFGGVIGAVLAIAAKSSARCRISPCIAA
jgi:hypothetical protein